MTARIAKITWLVELPEGVIEIEWPKAGCPVAGCTEKPWGTFSHHTLPRDSVTWETRTYEFCKKHYREIEKFWVDIEDDLIARDPDPVVVEAEDARTA